MEFHLFFLSFFRLQAVLPFDSKKSILLLAATNGKCLILRPDLFSQILSTVEAAHMLKTSGWNV